MKKTISMIDQPWFSHIQKPSRYLGMEINALKKDPGASGVSIALAFPDIYEVGMSHLGLKILYHILNEQEWISAERVFCPWTDLEKELRQREIPLTSCESNRPLSTFDIVGFSLQHELSFTNVLTMLDLSGIPFRSDQRDHTSPLLIAGGPACFNPEPVAPLFDAFVIGDGEEAALKICRLVREAKLNHHRKKEEILIELARIRGVYVPAFFQSHYDDTGAIRTIEPLLPGYEKIKKAVIPDIDLFPFPTRPVVPFSELIHDRLAIEISRGCTRGCRFCQAGMIYRPVRERHPESILHIAEKALSSTGFEEISLLSLSSGDYSCISPLLRSLMDRQSRDKTAISLPSLRIDSMDPVWFEQIKRVRKTGFTLAPETGGDRLRRLINKPLTNEEILKLAREVYRAGWNMIKLYFMIGLPGEEEGDLLEILHLAKAVARLASSRGKKAILNISMATFVPKSHTPFMWAPQISVDEGHRKIQRVQNGLKNSRVRVKWNQPEMSWLEGTFSRGDRRMSEVLIRAWELGARFDAWSEHYHMDLWQTAFQHVGLDPEFFISRSRPMDEIFPWDHIQTGVEKDYLKEEWHKAFQNTITPDCRMQCLGCGVCDHEEIRPVLIHDWSPPPMREASPPIQKDSAIKKYRLTFTKTEQARFIGHLELVRLFVRAFRRAGFNLVYSIGFHPLPKISFLSALPVGTESLDEKVDIQSCDALDIDQMKKQLNLQLPQGVRVALLEDITLEIKRPTLRESHYYLSLNGLHPEPTDLEAFLNSDSFLIRKGGKTGDQWIDARSLVKNLSLVAPDMLNLVLLHPEGPGLKPTDIIREVFHLEDPHIEGIRVLKTKQILEEHLVSEKNQKRKGV